MREMSRKNKYAITSRILNILLLTGAVTLSAQDAGPQLVGSRASMAFNIVTDAHNNVTQQSLTITSSGAPISFAVIGSSITTSGGAQWLSVSPLLNTTPATVTVTVDASALPPGNYEGSVNMGATDSSNAVL